MNDNLLKVFQQYFPDAGNVTFTLLPYGHIHDTYLADYGPSYILQKINHQIFRDIPSLMHNISQISSFLLENKYVYSLEIPALQYTTDEKPYVKDKSGDYWRVFSYIQNNRVYQRPVSIENAAEGGRALGIFTRTVSTLIPGGFNILLPRFHDVDYRMDEYQEALKQAVPERFKEAASDIRSAAMFYPRMHQYFKDLTHSDIPLRITHNDTKFNNFLFNSEDKALSIIDLDTIMPGYTLLDFGDAIRTVGNSAGEDERDTCNVRFDFRYFSAFTRAYLEQVKDVLTASELNLLADAPLYITYIQGLRFLTDHLAGDIYYPVRYFGHNLVRTAVQFTLLKQMEDKKHFIEEAIGQALNKV